MATPKPGDFRVGSVESRAAMRFQLAKQTDALPRMGLVSHIPRPWRGNGPEPKNWNKVPRVERSQQLQSLYVPPGMTEEEARKATGAEVCPMEMIMDAPAGRANPES